MFKKLFVRVSLYGLAPQVSTIASFFALPIITQDLTRLDYGVYGVIQAYTSAFNVLQTLGMSVVLSNSFYKHPNHFKWHWRQIHGFLSLWSFFFAMFLGCILYFVIPEEAAENKWYIIAMNFISVGLLGTTQTIFYRYYHLSNQAFTLAIRTVIIGILTVLVNIYTISYLKLGYMGWFISAFISSVISFSFFSFPIYFKHQLLPIFNFKRKTIKKALDVSLPTVPHYYSTYLLNISDRAIMDGLGVNVKNIGLYNLAYSFGGYFSSLVDAISLAVSPTYLQLYKNKDASSIKWLTYILQGGLFLVGFLICIWLKEIFQLLIRNTSLHEAYYLAIIIIMSYTYRPMYLAAINKLFFMEKTKSLWRVSFIAGVSNVILNLIFIPIYGIKAAAIITFVSYMYMGYSGYFLKDFRKDNTLNLYPLLWLLATVGLLVSAYLLVDVSVIIKATITIVMLAVTLVLFLNRHKYLPPSMQI